MSFILDFSTVPDAGPETDGYILINNIPKFPPGISLDNNSTVFYRRLFNKVTYLIRLILGSKTTYTNFLAEVQYIKCNNKTKTLHTSLQKVPGLNIYILMLSNYKNIKTDSLISIKIAAS